MNFDKISDDRLFINNTPEELKRWCQGLQYFHYMRARGGHNCEGDSFAAYFTYSGREDLLNKLSLLGVEMKPLEEGFIQFDPLESYSIDDLDKIKFTIPGLDDLEQPKHVTMFGYRIHLWIQPNSFEISISGSKEDDAYKVTDEDFHICLALEKEFDKLGWKNILDDEITNYAHCISKEKYPELY